MMRAIVLGALAVLSTLGGVFAATFLAGVNEAPGKKEETLPLEFIKLEPVSVPIIRGGKIDGYVVARISVAAAAQDVKSSKQTLVAYASESAFRSVFEDKDFDFSAMRPVDVTRLAERIAKLANERIGRFAIKQALVDSLNFVAKTDTRAPQRG